MKKRKKQTGYDEMKNQSALEVGSSRDVFRSQQVERSSIAEKQSPLSRIILTAIVSVFAAVLVYFICGVFDVGYSVINDMASGVGTSMTESTSQQQGGDASEGTPGGSTYNPSNVDELSFDEWLARQGYEEVYTPDGIRYQPPTGDAMMTWDDVNDAYERWFDENFRQGSWSESEGTSGSAGTDVTFNGEIDDPYAGVGFDPTFGFDFNRFLEPKPWKFFVAFIAGFLVFGIMYQLMMKQLAAQNVMSDVADINQYKNDQHIAFPEEIQTKFDWFPDVGAHCSVQVSSMISHMALSNKGLKSVELARRATEDIYDENGEIEYYKGEILLDEDGNPIFDKKPMIDEEFMEDLFETSGAPEEEDIRTRYDATKIDYNPKNKNRNKIKGCDTVADMINKDWEFPSYEPQRPGGAYLVDTEPVNTMVLAITRAGKGDLARLVG